MSKKMKQGLVPELRFPEFRDSGEWQLSPLKKLATSCTEKNRDGNIVRVLTNSAEHGIVDQRDYFDKDIAVQGNLEGYFIVEKGDFVYNPRISSMAPVGPISKNNIATGVMSPLYTVFRFNFENDDYYAHFFKTTGWHHYMRQVSSTGARHDRMAISKSDFIAMPIPAPTVQEEQQKIADCLSSVDELIVAHTQKHQALQSYKKGLLQNLFPAEGETVPALRFPEFDGTRDWELKPLAKVAKNLDSKRVPITAQDRVKGDVPYYGASGVIDYVQGYIFDERLLCISEDGANLVARTYPIAFSISGKTWVNNHAHVLKFNDYCTHVMVENYLNSISLEDYLTGMAQPKLNRAKLDIIPIPIPSIDEQQKIADCLSSVDGLINAQAQKVVELKAHRKGLMQQLFPAMDEVGA